MSVWRDLGLPEPHMIEIEEFDLIVEDGCFQGMRYGRYERRDAEATARFLSARDRRRLRRGQPLRPDRDRALKLRYAVSIGMEIAEMSNHQRLEFFARAGKTPISRPA